MSPAPGRPVRSLTIFLLAAGLISFASLVIGAARGSPADSKLAAGPPTTETPSATVPPVASSVPPPVTAATTTSTTMPVTTTVLHMFTVEDIAAAVGPKVAFITTFNGSGSGVLVGEDVVVTNAHVIWPFTTVGVLFPGDSRRAGRVVSIDPRADVAFIEVDSPRLPPPLPLGSTAALEEGSNLFVVGYPGAEVFDPEPTVDAGPLQAVTEWEFSGATWVHSGSPAIGGQSGGALVDEYGRLVGVTTFGSPSDLYSLSVEDVVRRLDALSDGVESAIAQRRPPRQGGSRTFDLAFEGPWEQAAFVTWLSPGARSQLSSDASVDWRALDPFGEELDAGRGELDVLWVLATPGVVLAEADGVATTTAEVSRPLVPLNDPDDARTLEAGPGLAGFVDVPGDRDWFYLEVTEDDSPLRIQVDAQTRVRISLFDRTSAQVVAEVVHERGFFFEDPILQVEGLRAGAYVVTVEDVGAQFGTYRVRVS